MNTEEQVKYHLKNQAFISNLSDSCSDLEFKDDHLIFGSELTTNYHSILGKKTEYNYKELETTIKYTEEFVGYIEEYKLSNNFFCDFDDLLTSQKMEFFILLFFIVS